MRLFDYVDLVLYACLISSKFAYIIHPASDPRVTSRSVFVTLSSIASIQRVNNEKNFIT